MFDLIPGPPTNRVVFALVLAKRARRVALALLLVDTKVGGADVWADGRRSSIFLLAVRGGRGCNPYETGRGPAVSPLHRSPPLAFLPAFGPEAAFGDSTSRDFAVVTRELPGKRPLEAIALATRIAAAKVEAFERR
jgi:hypothetical protein